MGNLKFISTPPSFLPITTKCSEFRNQSIQPLRRELILILTHANINSSGALASRRTCQSQKRTTMIMKSSTSSSTSSDEETPLITIELEQVHSVARRERFNEARRGPSK